MTSFESISKELNTLATPKQTYVKLTSRPGVVPDIVLEVWQTIWKMNAEKIGRKRAYIADFEIYDERSRHPNHGVVDVFIGIKK